MTMQMMISIYFIKKKNYSQTIMSLMGAQEVCGV